jgi:hypothetical protein
MKTLFAAFVLVAIGAFARAQDKHESTVGVPAKISEIVLPGSELEVAPTDPKNPIVARITATYPHGTAFRYDIEWYGLDPGDFDLRASLKRKDGTTITDLPRIPLSVRSILPAGIVKPHPPSERAAPALGGYTTLLIVGGVLWIAGLLALLFVGRKKHDARDENARKRPQTLAERLRPLVERAMQGTLSSRERAQLELSLVAHWRARLKLDAERPQDALAFLKTHAEAGPLLQSLEEWLHRPDTQGSVDVASLLAPYRDLPADALDAAQRS